VRLILALILLAFFLACFLFKEKAGVKHLKLTILAFTRTAPGKVFFIAAITSMIALALLLVTGVISISDLTELDMKMIEFCPFCMAA
jgi:hypothetical protein